MPDLCDAAGTSFALRHGVTDVVWVREIAGRQVMLIFDNGVSCRWHNDDSVALSLPFCYLSWHVSSSVAGMACGALPAEVQCHARMIRRFWQLHIALLSIKFHISRRKTIFTVGGDAGLWWHLLVPKFYDGESYPPEKVSLIFYPPHDVAKIQSHTLIILCINQMAKLILSRR